MARRKDDNIFKKLKKETPIVRRKDISPLSSRDFQPRRSSFDIEIEKKAKQRRTQQTGRPAPELDTLSNTRKKTVYRRKSDVKGVSMAGSYRRSRQQKPDGDKKELSIFAQDAQNSTAPANRPPEREKKTVRSTAAPARRADERLQPPISPRKTAAAPEADVQLPVRPKTQTTHRSVQYETDTASQGQLAFRHELKFYINYHGYIMLRNAMKALLSPDENTGADNTYHIRSLYFDDIYESAVKEKMAGVDERSKYRIRIYNLSDDVIRFEKKIKQGQYVAKKSLLLSRAEYEQIIAGEYDFLTERREKLASELYFQLKSNLLRPRLFVDYTREAYVSAIENVRVTFDKGLKAGLRLTDIFDPDTPVMSMLEEGVMVLEVKFNRFLPETIRCALSSIGTSSRSAVSKYVICRKFE